MKTKTLDPPARANRAAQLDPGNATYHLSRGLSPQEADIAARQAREQAQRAANESSAVPAPATPNRASASR
jgi:hypothetical protein